MLTHPHPLSATGLAWALLVGAIAPMATAQTDHSAHHAPATATTAPAELPWADAEVRRIDHQTGKISLRHGPIVNLDMPPMSMVFQMQDRTLLQRVKPGDRVRFTADQINGQYTVLQLEPLP